jgi:acetyl-CoA carboxylase biotin carboxyl carrier protein
MQMSASDIHAAAALLAEFNLGELVVESLDDGAPFRLRLAREATPRRAAAPAVVAPAAATPAVVSSHLEVTSTAVGSFRATATPVQAGDTVSRKQVLGSVESLKIPNDVLCPADGLVTEVLVEEAQGVEWGQILFIIEPTS